MALLPPIVNPGVPYVGPIEKGFTPGEMVRIQGLTSPTTDRFTINLQCGDGTDPGIDIALHVSVRVSENYVVLNTKENGTWGKEKIPDIPLPIGQGQHFEILLLCDDKDYKLAVNGQHFAEFHHRMDRSRVTHLSIKGNVEISLICYEGGTPAVPEQSKDAGINFAETPTANKDIDLSIDDFKPSAPLNPVYPTLPPADDTRGPSGYPGPGGYGPGPGGYGPPAGPGGYGPQPGPGGYGPPPGQGGYGPPGGYAPPAGQGGEKPGPFESILGQVGRAAADAISTGAIRGILAGPNAPPQHGPIGGGYPGYQGPGGGPLSSLLSSLTSGGGNSQGGGQSGGLGGALGGLLSGALSQHSQPSQGPVQGQYQGQGPYPPQGGPQSGGQNQGEGLGGFLSGALSSLMSGQNQRH